MGESCAVVHCDCPCPRRQSPTEVDVGCVSLRVPQMCADYIFGAQLYAITLRTPSRTATAACVLRAEPGLSFRIAIAAFTRAAMSTSEPLSGA